MHKYDGITDRRLHLPDRDVRLDYEPVRYWSHLTFAHSYGVYLSGLLVEVVSARPMRQLMWWDRNFPPEVRRTDLETSVWDSTITFGVRRHTELEALVERLLFVAAMGDVAATRLVVHRICVATNSLHASEWHPDNKD